MDLLLLAKHLVICDPYQLGIMNLRVTFQEIEGIFKDIRSSEAAALMTLRKSDRVSTVGGLREVFCLGRQDDELAHTGIDRAKLDDILHGRPDTGQTLISYFLQEIIFGIVLFIIYYM